MICISLNAFFFGRWVGFLVTDQQEERGFRGGVSVEARETKVRNTCTTRVEGPSSFRGKFPEETEKNKFYSFCI